MVIRVFAPFTEDHYHDKGERPNTGLAEKSSFINRDILFYKFGYKYLIHLDGIQ
jgi:hypothetical protein